MIDAVGEQVTLDCRLWMAENFEWKLLAKRGSPYAQNLRLSSYDDSAEPWKRVISRDEYHWKVMTVSCTPVLPDRSRPVTVLWVITKLKTSRDQAFHPITCNIPGAICSTRGTNCYYGEGKEYRGSTSHHEKNGRCQPWDSWVPTYIADDNAKYNMAHHNECRNWLESLKKKPWCYDAVIRDKWHYCNIPKCTDCAYGDGNGKIEGVDMDFPVYKYGNQRTTDQTMMTDKGVEVSKKCDKGSTCSIENDPDKKTAACRMGGKIEKCILTQCLVRQVYFLLIDPSGHVYQSSNEEIVTISLMTGRPATIQFFHFGTLTCSELKVKSEGSDLFLPFTLNCRNLPEASTIDIDRVEAKVEGTYELQYQFAIGNKKDARKFQARFQLATTTPTSLALTSDDACPGMPLTVQLTMKGSFPVDRRSIRWMISEDGKEWSKAELSTDIVELSGDSYSLLFRDMRAAWRVRVTGHAERGPQLTASRNITLKSQPHLSVPLQNIDIHEGGSAEMTVEYDNDAEIKWIFENKEIKQTGQANGNLVFDSDVGDQANTIKQTLRINNFASKNDGIYHIQAKRDGCVATRQIYASVL